MSRILIFLTVAVVLNGCGRSEKIELPENTPRLRALDFSPFEEELATFGEKKAARIRTLVVNATVLEIQKSLDAGQLTSEELTLYFLSRIQRHDEHLRSFTELNPLALEEARATDLLRAEGRVLGPLHGIPLNLKDNIGTKTPMHTTVGAEILLHHSPAKNAALVTRLRDGGAIILGKASLSELAGVLTTELPGFNAVSGAGINPYGADLPVAGSSSGSAISTSAGLTLLSVGTETSGSLIAPASMNGVVAMKPSLGLVPGEGIVPLIHFQDSAGPVARSVTDAAVLLSVIDLSEEDYITGLKAEALTGIPVGILRSDIVGLDDPSHNAWSLARIDQGLRAANAMPRDIATLDTVELLPVIFLGLALDTVPYLVEAGAPVDTLADLVAYNLARPETRIPRGQNMLEFASRFVATEMKDREMDEEETRRAYKTLALDVRNSAADILIKAFAGNGVEILVSLQNEHSVVYATAGFPAITIPLGLDEKGAPSGVTFIGKQGEDAELLARAFAFEAATHYRVSPDDVRE